MHVRKIQLGKDVDQDKIAGLTTGFTGADIATLELEIPNDGDSQPDWRLYRVYEPAASGA